MPADLQADSGPYKSLFPMECTHTHRLYRTRLERAPHKASASSLTCYIKETPKIKYQLRVI